MAAADGPAMCCFKAHDMVVQVRLSYRLNNSINTFPQTEHACKQTSTHEQTRDQQLSSVSKRHVSMQLQLVMYGAAAKLKPMLFSLDDNVRSSQHRPDRLGQTSILETNAQTATSHRCESATGSQIKATIQ